MKTKSRKFKKSKKDGRCFPNKQQFKGLFYLILWIICYFIYIILGAICIIQIEQDDDEARKHSRHEDFLDTLTKYNFSVNNTMIIEIVQAALSASNVGGLNKNDFSEKKDSSWNIGTGVFFTSSVVTTIGYGSTTPFTKSGRIFTIFYAIIGIPLTGIILGKIGAAITSLIKRADSFTEKYLQIVIGRLQTQRNKAKFYSRMFQFFFILFIIAVFFWFIPAAIFMVNEDWPYSTAVYFCFVSITTIGLGDIVPGVSDDSAHVHKEVGAEAITTQLSLIFYLILGLSAISIAISLITSLLTIIGDAGVEAAESMVNSKRFTRKSTRHVHEETDDTISHQSQTSIRSTLNVPTVSTEPTRRRKVSAYDRFIDTDLFNANHRPSVVPEETSENEDSESEVDEEEIKNKSKLDAALTAGLIPASIVMNMVQQELMKNQLQGKDDGIDGNNNSVKSVSETDAPYAVVDRQSSNEDDVDTPSRPTNPEPGSPTFLNPMVFIDSDSNNSSTDDDDTELANESSITNNDLIRSESTSSMQQSSHGSQISENTSGLTPVQTTPVMTAKNANNNTLRASPELLTDNSENTTPFLLSSKNFQTPHGKTPIHSPAVSPNMNSHRNLPRARKKTAHFGNETPDDEENNEDYC